MHVESSRSSNPSSKISERYHHQVLGHEGAAFVDEEPGTFGLQTSSPNLNDFFASAILSPNAFMSLDGADIYPDFDISAAHGSYETSFSLPPAGESRSKSPKSSHYSDDTPSVRCRPRECNPSHS